MEFVEGTILEQKTFNHTVFPKTLLPPKHLSGDMCTGEVLVEMVRENSEWLGKILERHSAVLFRGFKVGSDEDFARVVEAFGWVEMPYFGFISRNKVVGDKVFTANEAPLDKPISFHHEMSTVKEYPSKIFFFCAQPSPKGGETSILPGHIILEKMDESLPEFVSKLRKLGYVFQLRTAKEDETNNLISRTWKQMFQTNDKLQGDKRAKEKLGCTSVRFNQDGSAEFVYGPLDPIKQLGEKWVWFHHLVGRNEGDIDNYFGDGTPIPKMALDTYKNIVNENSVDIKWQKGDVLLVDNLSTQHARRPGEAPRRILVSICK